MLTIKIGSNSIYLNKKAIFGLQKNSMTEKELFEIIKESKLKIEAICVGEEAFIIGKKDSCGIWLIKENKKITILDIVAVI